MYQSVLKRPRDLDEDIYDLTDTKSKKYDKVFHNKIKEDYKTVKKFLASDTWREYTKIYHEKYSKDGKS